MTLSRRNFMLMAGSTAVIVAAGKSAINLDKMPSTAISAWSEPKSPYQDIAAATPAFAWITTSHNIRSTQLAVGRAYARLNLQATALGVAMHPMSQVLQEYAEMRALQRGFLAMLDIPAGHTVQMLVRLGYTERPDPSPRRELSDLLLS